MSYHIYVKNTTELTYEQVFEHSYTPDNMKVRTNNLTIDKILDDIGKFFIPFESSRGVWVKYSNKEYDIEVNIGSSETDYFLATRLALCLADLNDSLIYPEHNLDMDIATFEKEFNLEWAKEYSTLGVERLVDTFIEEYGTTLALNGCIRDYYVGNYVTNKLKSDNPNLIELSNRLIGEIKRLQYIEFEVAGLEVPTLRQVNFPDGTKTMFYIYPDMKLLMQSVDILILTTHERFLKLEYEKFIEYCAQFLIRLDECQYILNPISKIEFDRIIDFFQERGEDVRLRNNPNQNKKQIESSSTTSPNKETKDNRIIKWWKKTTANK